MNLPAASSGVSRDIHFPYRGKPRGIGPGEIKDKDFYLELRRHKGILGIYVCRKRINKNWICHYSISGAIEFVGNVRGDS